MCQSGYLILGPTQVRFKQKQGKDAVIRQRALHKYDHRPIGYKYFGFSDWKNTVLLLLLFLFQRTINDFLFVFNEPLKRALPYL